MTDIDIRTHRDCGHPREQAVPEDMPTEYAHGCIACLQKEGITVGGKQVHVDFEGERDREAGQ